MMKRAMTKGAAGSCRRPCAALAGRLPVPGEEFVQLVALGPTGDDALRHIGQIGLRIEFLELCRVNDRGQYLSVRGHCGLHPSEVLAENSRARFSKARLVRAAEPERGVQFKEALITSLSGAKRCLC